MELIVWCTNAGGFLPFPWKGLQARVRRLARPTWKVGRGSGVKGRDLGAAPWSRTPFRSLVVPVAPARAEAQPGWNPAPEPAQTGPDGGWRQASLLKRWPPRTRFCAAQGVPRGWRQRGAVRRGPACDTSLPFGGAGQVGRRCLDQV